VVPHDIDSGLAAAAGATGFRITRVRLRRQFERLGQQKALQHEQAPVASVLEGDQRLVAFADLDGNLLYLNRAGRRLLDMSETGELRPCKITEFLPQWAAKLVREEGLPHAIRDGIWRGETALLQPNGREVPLSQVIAVHRARTAPRSSFRPSHEMSPIASVWSSALPIRSVSKRSGRLAGGVAHDFNNLLTAILGFLSISRRQGMRRMQPPEHNIGIAKDRCQEIVKVMSDAAGQSADRFDTLRMGNALLQTLAIVTSRAMVERNSAEPSAAR